MNKLLISTIYKLVLYDKEPYTLYERKNQEKSYYTGITWNEDNVFIATKNHVIQIFDKTFNLIDMLVNFDLTAIHQIYWHNKHLYVVNTGLNRIEVFNGKWTWVSWYLAESDIDHINSIWYKDKRFYIVEFRQSKGHQSRIRICDSNLNSSQEYIIGSGIHNVYVEDGIIYTLMSRPSQLTRFGLDPISLTNADEGFIRGLARTKSFWYIGITRWEPDRAKRDVGNGVILQLDNEFNEVNRITLYDSGPIYDIRVIDEIDLAHNGIEF